jgi:hypothetical protein
VRDDLVRLTLTRARQDLALAWRQLLKRARLGPPDCPDRVW